jgi:hypothetical protein
MKINRRCAGREAFSTGRMRAGRAHGVRGAVLGASGNVSTARAGLSGLDVADGTVPWAVPGPEVADGAMPSAVAAPEVVDGTVP